MAKSKKRRVTRVGPKFRMWITLEEPTIAALRARGEKLGFSISALVQRVINRGVAAGLIDDASPTLDEQYYHLTEELCRTQKEHIEILQDRIDLKDQQIATQHQQLCEYSTALYGPYEGDQQARVAGAPDPAGAPE